MLLTAYFTSSLEINVSVLSEGRRRSGGSGVICDDFRLVDEGGRSPSALGKINGRDIRVGVSPKDKVLAHTFTSLGNSENVRDAVLRDAWDLSGTGNAEDGFPVDDVAGDKVRVTADRLRAGEIGAG